MAFWMGVGQLLTSRSKGEPQPPLPCTEVEASGPLLGLGVLGQRHDGHLLIFGDEVDDAFAIGPDEGGFRVLVSGDMCYGHGGSMSAAGTAKGGIGEPGTCEAGRAWSLCGDCGGVRMQSGCGCGCGCSGCSCNRRHRERRNGMLSLRQRRKGVLSLRLRRNGMMETESGASPAAGTGAGAGGSGGLGASGVVTVRTWGGDGCPATAASAPTSPAGGDGSLHPGNPLGAGYPGAGSQLRPATATSIATPPAAASARCCCSCGGCCCASGAGTPEPAYSLGAPASAGDRRLPSLTPPHTHMRATSAGIRGMADEVSARFRVMNRSTSCTPRHAHSYRPCTCRRWEAQPGAPQAGASGDAEQGATRAAAMPPVVAVGGHSEAGWLPATPLAGTAAEGGVVAGGCSGSSIGAVGTAARPAVAEAAYNSDEESSGLGSVPSLRLGVGPGPQAMQATADIHGVSGTAHAVAGSSGLGLTAASVLRPPSSPQLQYQPVRPQQPQPQHQHQSPAYRRISSGLLPAGHAGPDGARSAVAASVVARESGAASAAPAAATGTRFSAEAGSPAAALLVPPLTSRRQYGGLDSGSGGCGDSEELASSGSRPASAAVRSYEGLSLQPLRPQSPQPPQPQQWGPGAEGGVLERPVPRRATSLKALLNGAPDLRPGSVPPAEEARLQAPGQHASTSQQHANYAGSQPQPQQMHRTLQPQGHSYGGSAFSLSRELVPASSTAAAAGRGHGGRQGPAGSPAGRQPSASNSSSTITVLSTQPQMQRSASSLAALGPGSGRQQSLPNPEPLSSPPGHQHPRPPQRISGGTAQDGVLLLPPLGTAAAQHHAAAAGCNTGDSAGGNSAVVLAVRGAWAVAQQPLSGPAAAVGSGRTRRASTLSLATPVLSDVEDGSEEGEMGAGEGAASPATRLLQQAAQAWSRARQGAEGAAPAAGTGQAVSSSGGGSGVSGGGRLSWTHTSGEAQGKFSRVPGTLAYVDGGAAASVATGLDREASAEELSWTSGRPRSGLSPAHSGTGSGGTGHTLLARRPQLLAAIPASGTNSSAVASPGGGTPPGIAAGAGARLVSPHGSTTTSPSGAAAASYTTQPLTLPRIGGLPASAAANAGAGIGPGPGAGGR
ncbi:hypothetical protein CHLRE_02g145133v5 [Chlamydomonas reinhardtii]|uniref:Uncharacterized protein n=1 Tax=Chlamydomonas reinhardtii TaxID=3055 RepID=A0A2K3E3T1_CHLRE|nr:uncharacterized protein CHLRE_02g145133v5 [Chlamydomonas reinhardtii]PNW87450.1 hypothetical protein CHLRE_02g145133v5 [Chlamydomonas reinhardtii]